MDDQNGYIKYSSSFNSRDQYEDKWYKSIYSGERILKILLSIWILVVNQLRSRYNYGFSSKHQPIAPINILYTV